jgi:two-component system chemotaxis response regulator CheY
MKVVIVDDSRVMRQIVIRTLRQAGYDWWDIEEAEDGAAALVQIRASQPDFILSDWNMPEMTGIELLRNLRSEGNETPFAFVTSEGSPVMRDQAEQAGALFLIAKPFTADIFRDTIDPFIS